MQLKATTKSQSPYAHVGARLVDMGYSAIPVMPGSKRPGAMSHGQWYGDMDWSRFSDRLPTEFETAIWSRWDDAGVCVVLDHTVKVIDIDTDDADIIAAIEAVLPYSPVKKKGAKGYSAFYRGSRDIVNRPFNLVLPGGFSGRIIDLLAYGRQTVIPPTVHPELGEAYQWITEDTLVDTAPEALPELPDNIGELLEQALEPFGEVQEFTPRPTRGVEVFGDTIWREANEFALANLDAWVPALTDAQPRRQRDGSYRLVAFWRGGENHNVGVTEKGIVDWAGSRGFTPIDLIMAANAIPYFEPAYEWLCEKTGYKPAEEDWHQRYAESAARLCEKSRQRHREATEHAKQLAPATHVAAIPPVRAPRGKIDPFDPRVSGGLIGAIAEWSMSTARRPVPEFATLSAVAFLSAFFGRRAVGPTGAGLNTYLVGIAGPGFGKEHALKTVQTIAMDAKFQDLIGPGEVTSGSAIEKVVRKRPVFVMPWDEMGVVLQSVTGGGASSWAKTIRKVLLEIFSKSTSAWSGKEHADPTTDSSAEPIWFPTVSVLGMSTPTTFYKGLTEETMDDGFIARLVVIEAKERPARHDAPPIMVTPASLIGHLKQAQQDFPTHGELGAANWRNPKVRPSIHTVPWEDEQAERRWIQIEDWQIEQIEEHGAQDGLIGRTAEHTIKLATIRAISRNPKNPSVNFDDVEWGYAIVQRSIDCIENGVKEHMAGSQFEELCKAILRALRRSKTGEMAQSTLVRAKGVSKADDRMVKAALERLTVTGEIYAPKIEGRGLKIRLKAPDMDAA